MVPFQVVGQFLGFVLKDGYKVKYLRISVDKREYWFKPENHCETTYLSILLSTHG